MSGTVYPLQGNQLRAVDPEESVWLSASAGTGKTQVLSARVLRLLLQPRTDPSQILCLTFTKAGAAEMAVRINEVLARWVRLDDTVLARELGYLGAKTDPATREHARTLFASVLDCPGGGLRIDTIHAFSQWLLANFPNEAELIPGAQPMEDRERELLSREVLSDLLVEAEKQGDQVTLQAVSDFTRRKDPEALRAWLMRCAGAKHLWVGRNGWQPPLRGHVLRLLGLPGDAHDGHIRDLCADPAFDHLALRTCLEEYREWKSKRGDSAVAAINEWLSAGDAEKPELLGSLQDSLFFGNGNPKLPKSASDLFREASARVGASIAVVADFKHLLELSEFLVPALELGRKFALAWDDAKTREGLLDFDDLIERAALLLSEQVSADWIRYKLDRRFDHILIDEAQDTNEAQWSIIDALIDDFFSGEGAAGNALRTIFTVGDYKQAIFGFQGTSPENFSAARERVRKAMRDAAENAIESRHRGKARKLLDLDLGQSFRTSEPVLEFVDQAIAAIGPDAFGLDAEVPEHTGQKRAGLVTLWNPVHDNSDETTDDGEENWLARHDRQLAERIATQVQGWLTDKPFALEKDKHRNAKAGDIMVLVRSRKELASLIVARLHAKGVPVAGVDRLRLGAPLAVKDLMAAIRFAAQPLDNLNLANLLSSPLLGWSQDDLLEYVPRDEGVRLWHHLRKHGAPFVAETVERLRQLLALADFETPQALLQWMLVGPWKGRAKLIARLGREANDPIDELLNAAFAYEAIHTPSLAGFIQWFDASDDDLKRDPDQATNFVRVMTVHGSKGLQAPIVIMADAASRPGRVRDLALEDELARRKVPLPALNAEERRGPIQHAYDDAEESELKEHWRLLYVAMTRAEEALFIGGSLGKRDKAPHENSWYARLEPLFGDDALEDDLWGARREIGERAKPAAKRHAKGGADSPEVELPAWARAPLGPEPRPPRPLAPSSAGDDKAADPPLPPDMIKHAARRGVLIHALLERLPEIKPDMRRQTASDWLERQAADLTDDLRAEMLETALAVLGDPAFAEILSPAALTEVPLAATVERQVVAGIADRLLVTPDKVTVVDFKSARRPPLRLEDIPVSTIQQMAAYAAALEVIYPGRAIEAALLYTQTPQLFTIPGELLVSNKPRLSTGQESFAVSPVE